MSEQTITGTITREGITFEVEAGSGGGTTVHNLLSGRDAAEAHPAAAIDVDGTPLDQFLDGLPTGGADLSDATPQALGTAAAGVSTEASRADHVHAMPSAADVGADPAGSAAAVTTTSIGAVPTSRTINGLDLTTDRSLTASDVGADPAGSAAAVTTTTIGAVPTARSINGYDLTQNRTLTASDVGALSSSVGRWTVISNKVLSGTSASESFTVTGYRHVRARVVGRNDASSATIGVRVRFNGDTGSNYYVNNNPAATSVLAGTLPGSLTNTDRAGILEILVSRPDSHWATGVAFNHAPASNGTTGANPTWVSLAWSNASAMSSLDIYPSSGNFVAGTLFVVEGIA